jgi:ribosomal protein S18 acetylase RimI-like enzyme
MRGPPTVRRPRGARRVFQVLSLTAFALLLARMLRAPAGSWRYIVAAAVAVLAGSQLLPAGNAFRADVAGSARGLFWLGLAAIPVALYAGWLRRLRQRTGVDTALRGGADVARPHGLVQFRQDATLAAETRAALETETDAAAPGDRLSLGWRGDDGALLGHLRLRVAGNAAEIEMLRVAPEARRQGIGAALLRAGEGEAASRGASRIGALIADWQVPDFFAAAGYAEGPAHAIGGGRHRRWMEKALA